MGQLKFYKLSSLVLLLLNLALIAIPFFMGGPPATPAEGIPGSKRAIDILQLDDVQHEAFLASAGRHGEEMQRISEEQRQVLRPYFKQLIDRENTSAPNSILQQITTLEAEKIELTYQHFEEVKNLLREDQQANFEEFMRVILQLIFSKQQKPPPPH